MEHALYRNLSTDWWDPLAQKRPEERAEVFAYQCEVISDALRRLTEQPDTQSLLRTCPHRSIDVGCGKGRYTNILEAMHLSPVSLDISENMVEYARKSVSDRYFTVADAYQIPFRENSFAFRLAVGLSTHTEDFSAVVIELSKITAPGGYVIFNTANPDSIYTQWCKHRNTFQKPHMPYALYHHTKKDTGRIIRSAHLAVTESIYIGSVWPLSLGPSWTMTVINGKTARKLSGFIDPMLGRFIGHDQIFVCKKAGHAPAGQNSSL